MSPSPTHSENHVAGARPETGGVHGSVDRSGPSLPTVIRSGTRLDDARCGEIVGEALAATDCPARVPHARHVMEDRSPLPADDFTRFVAESGGRLAGFIDLDTSSSRIARLYVAPCFQGAGVGSALLRRGESELSGDLALSTLAVNDRALHWYLRRGYQITGGKLVEDWVGGPAVFVFLGKPREGFQSDSAQAQVFEGPFGPGTNGVEAYDGPR